MIGKSGAGDAGTSMRGDDIDVAAPLVSRLLNAENTERSGNLANPAVGKTVNIRISRSPNTTPASVCNLTNAGGT